MSRLAATIITTLLAIFSYYLVTACTDDIFLNASPNGSTNSDSTKKAAIAIRDAAPGYLQWGTEHFTVPYLERYYDEWHYFNQAPNDNQKADFLGALTRALKKYKSVDLYLLAHSNYYYSWVKEIKPALRKNLRLVYNSGCENIAQGRTWLKLGAKSYIGHPGRSASPLFYFYFLRRWTRNATLEDAVFSSNKGMSKLLNIGSIFSTALHPDEVYQESAAHILGNSFLRF